MANEIKTGTSRIDSIDLVRGIIMILMLLDHARDFFHQYAMVYDPEDLTQTTPIIFFTRWITHLCAPTFVLLAGVSAFLYQERGRTRSQVQKFLISRGLFLILMEETIISLAWRFSIDLTTIRGLVIWALGWSMIALALLLFLNRKTILIVSLTIICLHNLLDPLHFENKVMQAIWSFLHEEGKVEFLSSAGEVVFTWRILYPVLPMIGLIGLGYWIGGWYKNDYKADIRQGMLFNTGLIMISAFVLIRFLQFVFIQYDYIFYFSESDIVSQSDSNNVYVLKNLKHALKTGLHYFISHFGDPSPMVVQEEASYTLMSFLNVTKYPFSLQFILVTLGPLFLLLSLIETAKIPVFLRRFLNTIGSVPLFYYLVHLFVLRLMAFLIVLILYPEKISLVKSGQISAFSQIVQLNIFMVYLLSVVALAILYPLCMIYARQKKKGKSLIYSYI